MKRTVNVVVGFLLCGIMWASTASANIVDNGGFETGAFSPSWTQFGNTGYTFVEPVGPNHTPHSGTYFGMFAPKNPGGSGGVYQDLATVNGMLYNVDFWLSNKQSFTLNPPDNLIEVKFGGTALLKGPNKPFQSDYVHYQFVVAGVGTTTRL
jgi:hypothetical protein